MGMTAPARTKTGSSSSGAWATMWIGPVNESAAPQRCYVPFGR
ncbi:MAG TPA: hypothetical protein VI547_06740 [Anaerolineales bacterium]|nr:hypothetical protein [Anaerolineales bacterium]